MATKNFNRDFFNAILSNVDIMTLPSGMTAGEMREWATHQIDLLNRKNVNKKPTATQEAAAVSMESVQAFLEAHKGECFTCSDLMTEGLFPADKQSQYASRICNNLVNEGNAEKGTLKGKTVFMAVGTFDTIEGIKPYKVSK